MNELPTLYRLADGTQGNPGDCKADDKGVLRNNNGMPVVIDSDGKPVEIKREARINKAELAAELGKSDKQPTELLMTASETPAPSSPPARTPTPAPAHPAPAAKPADDGKKPEPR